jgi:predicted TIM-barrel fold metal-dependent hydrolase
MLLNDFHPRPSLVTPVTSIERPRFPVIDAHDHLMPGFGDWIRRPLPELLALLDEANVRVFVDLDGCWGEDLFHSHLDYFKAPAPQRFRTFCGIDWSRWFEHGDAFGEWAARKLHEHARQGADGLKVWKDFGLHVRDQHGARVAVDDPRLDVVWAAAGELGLPVTFHVADPVAFFDPLTPSNERWEELQAHPDWHFPNPPFPPFLDIVNAMANVIRRHPHTTFIGAHVGCYAENLGWVGGLMDACPNFYIDISARIGELGRQPYAARRFFIRHADRILFGTDTSPILAYYRLYARFLETDDEYFDYGIEVTPAQGRWQIYGLHLPDDVLQKVYYQNAARLFKAEINPETS